MLCPQIYLTKITCLISTTLYIQKSWLNDVTGLIKQIKQIK